MIDINAVLAKIGADAPGNFKVYAGNSRLKIFIKAAKLPTQPTAEVTLDLPGEAEEAIASGANYVLAMLKGNAQDSPPSN